MLCTLYLRVAVVGSREFECCMCKMKVNSGSNLGRVFLRTSLDSSGYDASPANEIEIRVCEKCKSKGMKPKTATYDIRNKLQIYICNECRLSVLLFYTAIALKKNFDFH